MVVCRSMRRPLLLPLTTSIGLLLVLLPSFDSAIELFGSTMKLLTIGVVGVAGAMITIVMLAFAPDASTPPTQSTLPPTRPQLNWLAVGAEADTNVAPTGRK